MNPNNLILTKLATVRDKLVKSGHLTLADSKEARDLVDEWDVLIDMSRSCTFAEGEPKRHLEARTQAWAARTVDFLGGQFFPTVQVGFVLGQNDNPDLHFRPVEISGDPLSTTILRDRR